MKIISIDDSRSVHAYIDLCLKNSGHEVIHFYSGLEALEYFRKGERSHVILLDWEMPGLTGPETLKLIQELDSPPPVLMVTTKNEVEDIQKVLSLGASEYVMKPFTAEILLEKISQVA